MPVAGTTGKKDGAFLCGLRVRVKELAQEAKFIRHEENKIKSRQKIIPLQLWSRDENGNSVSPYDKGTLDWRSLNSHRRGDVREAARAAQLAYGFLRGIPYKNIEGKRKLEKEFRFKHYIIPEIKRLATKFGRLGYKQNYDQEVENWLNAD